MFECELFDAGADDKGYVGDINLPIKPEVGLEFNGFRIVEILPDAGSGSDYFLLIEYIATV